MVKYHESEGERSTGSLLRSIQGTTGRSHSSAYPITVALATQPETHEECEHDI